ncbi:MAG: DsrE family protein [Gammaproteobacteria bacterium]|nr:MAG: DsrE family protein [Gammaproteobacteria bacterium]
MPNKMLIMMTSGPDTPTRLGTPFHQAMTAMAMDAEEVTVIFAMEGTRLLKTGVADKIYLKENSENSVYQHMQNAKECGVCFYVCPSSLKLHDMTLQDCIPELDGAMGTASYVELGMRDDVVVFCY